MQRMGGAVTLVAGHAENFMHFIGSRLDTLAEDIRRVDGVEHPELALPLLQRFKAVNADLGGATLILPNGQFIASTAQKPGTPLPNALNNPDWRADFQHDLSVSGLTVNRPQFAYLLQKWIIPLRYTARDPAGKVLFLIQTSIPLERQQAIWRTLALQPGIAFGLMREDGYVISHYPGLPDEALYRKRQMDHPVFRATHASPLAGSYEGPGLDQSYRIGAYQRLGDYPLYALVSLPRSTMIAMWWQFVRIPFFLMLAALLASVVLYWYATRRFTSRMRIIRQSMESGDQLGETALLSSGVGEIDTLVDALAESQQRLGAAAKNRERLLLSAAQAGTYVVRVSDGTVIDANDIFIELLQSSREAVVGKSWAMLLSNAPGETGTAECIQTQGIAHRVVQFRSHGGNPRWLSLAEYEEQADGEVLRYGLAIDVSEREQLLSTVRTQSERFHALWQLATNRTKTDLEKVGLMLGLGMDTLGMDGAMITAVVGEQMFIRHTAGALTMLDIGQGFAVKDTLCSQVMSTQKGFFDADLANSERYRAHPVVVQMGFHAYASVPVWVGERIYGTLVFLRRDLIPGGFSDDDKAFIELLASWFSQTLLEQTQREVLENLAMTDSLTMLPNRRAAEIRFLEEISRAKRNGKGFSVGVCDLDRFKLINDHYGHDVGDEVLRQVAVVMKGKLREGDWLARWGGEEFIVFLHQSDSQEAFTAMERLRLAIKDHPLQTKHGILEITTSIGIGVLRSSDEDIARVLSEADGCLYDAKKSGRDQVMVSEAAHRGTLWRAGMLQHALQESRIVPASQVMVDLNTGLPVADESLARLVQPDGEVVTASEFIEAAEGINLIHVVDSLMARQALSRFADGILAGTAQPGFVHFINLSPQFLSRKELVDALLQDAKNFSARCHVDFSKIKPIVLEVTERQLLLDFKGLKRDLQPLLDYGFRLALDDFGSGYSSFLYLAELPISFLKIEGWMVSNMVGNERVLSMVRSIVILAKQLNIQTIAECVEDAETAALLKEMGVDWGQGYLFGHPVLCGPIDHTQTIYS